MATPRPTSASPLRNGQKVTRYASQPVLNETKSNTVVKNETKKKIRSKPKKKKKAILVANTGLTKYSLVNRVCREMGFTLQDNTTNECLLIWSDSALPIDKIAELKSYQKVNHFAGMGEICRKDSLARNIWRIQRICPKDFNFVPQSWILPGEYAMFQFHHRELKKKKRSKTYIRKPVNGAMGHGIWLTRNADKIQANDTCIVQEYLDKPLLLDGYKFDLRMYVLVTSCDPLKIFLYKDGLVRLGTEPYTSPSDANISHSFMHLTNYSINKHSDNFLKSSETSNGSKRTLKYFWNWLKEKNESDEIVWNRITDVIIKTLLVAEPHLFHAYHMCRSSDPPQSNCCFEILGFDIFIDKKLKPWVIEVNRAPSFGTDQDLDLNIKHGVLSTSLKLLNIQTSDRRQCLKGEKSEAQKRLLGSASKKRIDSAIMLGDKKKMLQKRKKDLKWQIDQLRKIAEQEAYEDKHKGEFVRIYPPSTKSLTEYYDGLLQHICKVITGRPTLKKNTTNNLYQLKEEELLDLLQEVENDVLHTVDSNGRFILQGPQPLSSMPSAQKPKKKVTPTTPDKKVRRSVSQLSNHVRNTSSVPTCKSAMAFFDGEKIRKVHSQEDEAKTCEVLQMLLEMKIKYPGKTDEEANLLLERILDNWKLHRARVAAYWLVKLDATKRRKVIDIVKGNVDVILQRVWKLVDVDSLTLHRMCTKLFNRLLWSHGQGLWNCFNTNGDSWERIFTKSTESFSQKEMECCRQIVKLCRSCLLVVYQFANETNYIKPSMSTAITPSHLLSFSPTSMRSNSRTLGFPSHTRISSSSLIGSSSSTLIGLDQDSTTLIGSSILKSFK